MNAFTLAMAFVAKWEWANRDDGALHTDPNDPGGATKFGIAQKFHPKVDVANLTLPAAMVIYKSEYWDACKLDGVDFPIAMAMFDTAINCGVSKALKFRAQASDPTLYLQLRIAYYKWLATSNSMFQKELDGWLNRVNDLKKYIDIHKSDV